jgi:hypothetical protein
VPDLFLRVMVQVHPSTSCNLGIGKGHVR